MHQHTAQGFSSCQCTWWEKPLCTNHYSVTLFGIALTVECTVICAWYSLCVVSLQGQGPVYITCMVDKVHALPKLKAIQAMTHAYLCIIHFFCFVNICKEILCIHVAVRVEKHPIWTVHVKSWVCMTFQLTRHVSNALRCLSSVGIHGQVCASLSLPEWLMGGFTPVSFCSCTAACSFRCSHLAQLAESYMRAGALTCYWTWADRWSPFLTLRSSTLLYLPGSHSNLGHAPMRFWPELPEWGEFWWTRWLSS